MQADFESFGLHPALQRGLAKAGFSSPTPVQQAVIPSALAGRDLLVSAATGSGKTAAFLLPVMQRLLERSAPRAATRALILVPTRELAQQIETHFFRLGSYSRLGFGVIIGGPPRTHQIPILRKNPEIIVATPGRLLDHLRGGEADLGDLELLVLDEADRMLDLGFAEDVLAIIHRSRVERQSLLFSATLHHRRLEELIGPLLKEPLVLGLDSPRASHPSIEHQLIRSDHQAQKDEQLLRLLATERAAQVLIFANKRERVMSLSAMLIGHGERAAALHGALDQRERNRVLGLFRDGRVRALVASDVAARGLDIPAVGLVVHFDVPRRGDDYLHRSGRTGRAGQTGLAVALVDASEWHRMESIRRYLALDIQERVLPGLKARFRVPPKRGKSPKSGAGTPRRGKAEQACGGDGKTEAAASKVKQRWRHRKQIGKRRKPEA